MGQVARDFETKIVRRLKYLLFLPDGHGRAATKWPMILFLHGAGERGDDLNLVKKHGIPKVVEGRPDFPFIAVSPQCPADSWWSEHVDTLMALVEHIIAEQAADSERIYLTGLSMGGFGTWHLATAHPDRFAAIAPICGGWPWYRGSLQRVSVLKDMPVWVFHGAKDTTVPLEESEKLVEALRAYGGNVRFTVYPEAGHDAWTETYNNPELYDWFLSHRRSDLKP